MGGKQTNSCYRLLSLTWSTENYHKHAYSRVVLDLEITIL